MLLFDIFKRYDRCMPIYDSDDLPLFVVVKPYRASVVSCFT